MKGVRAGNADLRKAQRHFKQGYWLASSGSNHFVVMGPDDQPVRRNDGSGRHLGLPSSPRHSSISYHLRRLRDHGVLDQLGVREHEFRESTSLVRDDLAGVGDPEANNVATKQILEDIADVGIPRPRSVRDFDELAVVLSLVSAEPPNMTYRSLMRLYNGSTLTVKEQAPFIQLIGILEEEEDPIRFRFNLLRQARGLPPDTITVEVPPVEEEPQQEEEKVSTPAETIGRAMQYMGDSVEGLVGAFISDLRDQVNVKLDEINKIEDLISTLEEQYPSITVEADDGHGEDHGNTTNGGTTRGSVLSRTQRSTPQTLRVEPEEQPASRRGRNTGPSGLTGDKIMEVMDQGGEWTLQELQEATGVASVSPVKRVMTDLIEGGKAVIVTPWHTSPEKGKGRVPATYGSTEHYKK